MDWNDWLTYLRESGHLERSAGDGYLLHWQYPGGVSLSIEFSSRQNMITHLRATAMQDLREDAVMQRDARYAVTTGDKSLIDNAINEHRPPPSPEALEAHHRHKTLARRAFRRQEDLQLKRAAELNREFRTARASELYGRRLAVESARHSAVLLEQTLEGSGTPPPRRRL